MGHFSENTRKRINLYSELKESISRTIRELKEGKICSLKDRYDASNKRNGKFTIY